MTEISSLQEYRIVKLVKIQMFVLCDWNTLDVKSIPLLLVLWKTLLLYFFFLFFFNLNWLTNCFQLLNWFAA